MSSIFRKNLHLCFFKIRCLPTSQSPPLTLEDDEEHEFEFQEKHLKNSTIYYEPSLSSSSSTTIVDELFTSTSSSSDAESPDLSAIFASQRLFVSSPGHSNSILDSLPASKNRLVGGGVPINKYSPNPYADFRSSMQQMIDAHKRHKESKKSPKRDDDDDDDGNNNYDMLEYLQELLLCYLNLNPKHTHKFIIEAFADVLVSLMST